MMKQQQQRAFVAGSLSHGTHDGRQEEEKEARRAGGLISMEQAPDGLLTPGYHLQQERNCSTPWRSGSMATLAAAEEEQTAASNNAIGSKRIARLIQTGLIDTPQVNRQMPFDTPRRMTLRSMPVEPAAPLPISSSQSTPSKPRQQPQRVRMLSLPKVAPQQQPTASNKESFFAEACSKITSLFAGFGSFFSIFFVNFVWLLSKPVEIGRNVFSKRFLLKMLLLFVLSCFIIYLVDTSHLRQQVTTTKTKAHFTPAVSLTVEAAGKQNLLQQQQIEEQVQKRLDEQLAVFTKKTDCRLEAALKAISRQPAEDAAAELFGSISLLNERMQHVEQANSELVAALDAANDKIEAIRLQEAAILTSLKMHLTKQPKQQQKKSHRNYADATTGASVIPALTSRPYCSTMRFFCWLGFGSVGKEASTALSVSFCSLCLL